MLEEADNSPKKPSSVGKKTKKVKSKTKAVTKKKKKSEKKSKSKEEKVLNVSLFFDFAFSLEHRHIEYNPHDHISYYLFGSAFQKSTAKFHCIELKTEF